jgi:hypothetical protein
VWPVEPDPQVAGRRLFLRRLGGQAIDGAGRLAGLSGVVQRSMIAAGDAVVQEIGPPNLEQPAAPDALAAEAPPSAVGAAPSVSPGPSVTPLQVAFLASVRSGVIAANERDRAPRLSRTAVTWEDGFLRVPTAMFSARANAIDRDPRVSILLDDPVPGGGRWVAVVGTATLKPDPSDQERAVIVVQPSHFTWQIG